MGFYRGARAFLQSMALNLAPEDMAEREHPTEGSIAEVRLAAFSVTARTEANGFMEGFSGDDRSVRTTSSEAVLHVQPEQIRWCLLVDVVLERLRGG